VVKTSVRAYSENPRKKDGSPLAVLRFEKLNLRVPVFEGTDDWTLDRGAGWIEGTARLGEAGNIGIAGHRDGFFRGLKDVGKGDAIELASTALTATFLVDQIEIVDPEDVAVLQPRPAPSLTLVTCYPFLFRRRGSQAIYCARNLEHAGAKPG
jgi:sortase A